MTDENKTQFQRVREWADSRGILSSGTNAGQIGKLLEEVGELSSALLLNNLTEIDDAIGDCTVVLTILAAINGMMIEECLEKALNVIEKRKGGMVNGVFVKEND